MTTSNPTQEQWHRLYQASIQLKELAPWEWMTETDIFGVQNPETGELGFVSIMGQLGEHYALALYLGAEGLLRFWNLLEVTPDEVPELLFEIPHLQASFEDRNILTQRDRDLIKELGFKFRGRNAWSMFRSYRPGYFPWYLEEPEARFLTDAIEQVLDVAPRFRKDPGVFAVDDDQSDEPSYLVRVPRQEGGNVVWEDQVVSVPLPQSSSISIPMDPDALSRAKQLPRAGYVLEMDFFPMPVMVGERGTRPAVPYNLLIVERENGLVLGTELLVVESTLEEMWSSIPVRVVYAFLRTGYIPRQVRARSPLLLDMLQLLTPELGFRVQQSRSLRSLDQAKDFLLDRFI